MLVYSKIIMRISTIIALVSFSLVIILQGRHTCMEDFFLQCMFFAGGVYVELGLWVKCYNIFVLVLKVGIAE